MKRKTIRYEKKEEMTRSLPPPATKALGDATHRADVDCFIMELC
jgi:hypothetical protein